MKFGDFSSANLQSLSKPITNTANRTRNSRGADACSIATGPARLDPVESSDARKTDQDSDQKAGKRCVADVDEPLAQVFTQEARVDIAAQSIDEANGQ